MTQKNPQDEELLLTPVDVSRRLNMSLDFVYRLIKAGKLDALRIGGTTKPRLRIPADSLAEYLMLESTRPRFNEDTRRQMIETR